jgi:hypothetical protein
VLAKRRSPYTVVEVRCEDCLEGTFAALGDIVGEFFC